MYINQISVFLENEAGSLQKVTGILSDAGVDLRALCIADTRDYGILRIIVSDEEVACRALRENGKAFTVTPVLAVELDNRPGSFNGLLLALAREGLSIEYAYAFLSPVSGKAQVVLRVEDNEKASNTLEAAGYNVIAN